MVINHPVKPYQKYQNDENSLKRRSNTFSKKATLNFEKDELCLKSIIIASNLPE